MVILVVFSTAAVISQKEEQDSRKGYDVENDVGCAGKTRGNEKHTNGCVCTDNCSLRRTWGEGEGQSGMLNTLCQTLHSGLGLISKSDAYLFPELVLPEATLNILLARES